MLGNLALATPKINVPVLGLIFGRVHELTEHFAQ